MARRETAETLLIEDGEWMHCPFCGSEYTHVDSVTIGMRGREDGPAFVRTIDVMTGARSEAEEPVLEFSRRRQWLEIHIDCEFCAGGSVALAQVKGVTECTLVPADGSINRNPTQGTFYDGPR